MRALFRALVLAAVLSPPPAAAQTAGPSYDDLVARAKRGVDVDFRALREAYAASPRYDPYDGPAMRLKTPLFDAFAAKNCQRATGIATQILDADYVNIDAHLIADRCYRELGDIAQADAHGALARGLLDAIAATGDGRSPETAFVVIAVEEEYSFLRAQGYEVSEQALVNYAGNRVDRVEATDTDTSDVAVVFFNVERPLSWLDRELKKKKD